MGSPLRKTLLAWNAAAPVASGAMLWQGHPLGALALLASAHWPWLYATLLPRCTWWGPQTNRTGAGQVWLTIDDGPDPEDTPRLLDQLDAAGAKATFFMIGGKVLKHPHLAAEVTRRGHQIGNHTMTHPAGWFWAAPRRIVEREIAGCQHAIQQATGGTTPQWFRAPAGLRNHSVHPVLAGQHLRLAGWSARGFDGVSKEADWVIRRLRPNVRPGAVILMHEGRAAADGRRMAPQVLRAVLEEIQRRGLIARVP